MMKIRTALKYFFALWAYYLCTAVSVFADDDLHCKTLKEYVAEGTGESKPDGSGCLLCGIYEVVMQACANVVTTSWNAFAQPLQGVVAVGAAIYIAVYTLRNIATFSQQDPAAYLSGKTGIIPLGVKVAAVIWLLGHESFLYQYLIGPVIGAGMNIGAMFGSQLGGGSSGFTGVSNVGSLFRAVIDKVQEFNDNAYQIVAIGRLFICLAFLPRNVMDWLWPLVPYGAVLYVFGWFIVIGVSFYLLDVLFRLAVACMLLPMAIACGVSKLTSKYTKSNWNLFVNVFFNFVMMGILLDFMIKMIDKSLGGAMEIINKNPNMTGKQLSVNAAEDLLDKLETSSFILTTVCCMVGFKLFMELEQLAEKVSSTSSVGKEGSKLGAITNKVVTAPAKAIGKAGMGLAGATVQQAGSDINDERRKLGRKIAGSPLGQAIGRSKFGRAYSRVRRALRI